VAVPPGALCQDEAGRLWDVLWLMVCAARRGAGGPEVRFAVRVRTDNRERTPPLVRLKAVCGPGDQGEPVVTIMLPTEDGHEANAPGSTPGASFFAGVSLGRLLRGRRRAGGGVVVPPDQVARLVGDDAEPVPPPGGPLVGRGQLIVVSRRGVHVPAAAGGMVDADGASIGVRHAEVGAVQVAMVTAA
jgi:hypothetical protein